MTATISARDAQRDVFRALTQEPTWSSDMQANGVELHDVVSRMFAVAQMCARAGRQSEAVALLKLARDKQRSRRDTSSRVVRSAAAIEVHRAARRLAEREESEDLWRIDIMQQLLQQNAPEPWPATLVSLCTEGCHDPEGVIRAFCMLAKKRYLAARLPHRHDSPPPCWATSSFSCAPKRAAWPGLKPTSLYICCSCALSSGSPSTNSASS